MRLLFVASVISVVAVGATFACSSSDPAAAAADAGKDAKAPATTTDDDDDQADSSVPDPVVDDPADAGADDAEAGEPTGTGGVLTPGGDGGTACKSDDDLLAEAEPNNDAAGANTWPAGTTKTFGLCGQVNKDDVDVYTFTTPEYNKSFGASHGGNVKFNLKIGNQTFDGFPNNIDNVNPGDKWTITVSSGSDSSRSYFVRVEFK